MHYIYEVYVIYDNKFDMSVLKEKENIKLVNDSKVTKLNASDKMDSVEVTNSNGDKQEISVSGLFIAIGRVPENENFRKLIDLNEKGYIIASENCHTNIDGIFAAGDNRVKSLRQIVTATGDGAIAAVEAIKYINKEWRSE